MRRGIGSCAQAIYKIAMLESASEAKLFIKRPLRAQGKLRLKDSSGSQETMGSTLTTLKPVPRSTIKTLQRKPSSRTLIHCETLQRFAESAVDLAGEAMEKEKRGYQSMSKIAPAEGSDFFKDSSFAEDDSVINELADLLKIPDLQPVPPKLSIRPSIRTRSSVTYRRENGAAEKPKSEVDLAGLLGKSTKTVLRRKKTGPLSLSKLLTPPVTTRVKIMTNTSGRKLRLKPVVAVNL